MRSSAVDSTTSLACPKVPVPRPAGMIRRRQWLTRWAGRSVPTMSSSGENIRATEVEELISEHPKVEQVAVVGMPDPILGERACAYIKPRGGAMITLEEITALFKERKASILLFPERIEPVEELPFTNVGKVDKKKLREEIKEKLKQEGRV